MRRRYPSGECRKDSLGIKVSEYPECYLGPELQLLLFGYPVPIPTTWHPTQVLSYGLLEKTPGITGFSGPKP